MSSYELLELVEHMDDRGAYKMALRGGELCPSDEMLRNLHNEVAMLRATMQAVHGGQQYSPKIFESISERRERVEKEESVAEGRENFYSLADRSARVSGQVDFDDAEVPTPRKSSQSKGRKLKAPRQILVDRGAD